MTVSLQGSNKFSLFGIGRKSGDKTSMKARRKKARPEDIAKLFSAEQKPDVVKTVKPRELNETEIEDRETIGDLRGALYSSKR